MSSLPDYRVPPFGLLSGNLKNKGKSYEHRT